MRYIYFLIILLLLPVSLYSTSYTIQYKEAAKSIIFYTIMPARIDSKGDIILSQVFDIPVNIRQVRIYHKGRYIPCRSIMRSDHLVIKRTGLKDVTADLFLDYSVEMKIFRRFILPGGSLVIPLYIFKPSDITDLSGSEATCYVELPTKWSLMSPSNWKKIDDTPEGHPIYLGTTNWTNYPMIMAGIKLLDHTPSSGQELMVSKPYRHAYNFFWYGRKPIRFIMRDQEKNEIRLNRLNKYVSHIENYLGIEAQEQTFNILLYSGLMNITVAVDDAMLMSASHLQSLNYPKENNNTYQVIYELTYMLIRDRIDYQYFERDAWLIDGICHMVAANYFQKEYGLSLNYTNTNPFLKFLFGKRNSMYTRSGMMFRDYIKFKKITSITKDNTPKLVGYNYRSRSLKNRYAMQVFQLISTLHSNSETDLLIRKMIEYSRTPISTPHFLEEIEYWLSAQTAETVSKYINKYPLIDYQLKRGNDSVAVVRKKGDAILPLTIEYVYKTGKTERHVILMDSDSISLDVDLNEIKRITIDPDSLIDEISKGNNYYHMPVGVSLFAPFNIQDTYSFAINAALVNYYNTYHFGVSLTGGWNMKQFTSNTLTRPRFFWGIDIGYGYNTNEEFRWMNNFFINLFFETSVNPLSVWAPHIYSQIFYHLGEGISFKTGIRSFIPPIHNTEYDHKYFNHSWDAGIDFKIRYSRHVEQTSPFDEQVVFDPGVNMGININTGYKIYFKSRFYTMESTIAVNFDFDSTYAGIGSKVNVIELRSINVAGQVDNKFDFRIIEFGLRLGIMKSNIFKSKADDQNRYDYEYQRPKITRFSLVTQSTGYYETIANNLTFANSLSVDLISTTMDFFFIHHYFLFKIVVISEPLLDPLMTIGFGTYLDFALPLIFRIDDATNKMYYDNSLPRILWAGIMLKIDIMRKTSIILRYAAAPFFWVNNNFGSIYQIQHPDYPMDQKVLSLVLFEIRKYL